LKAEAAADRAVRPGQGYLRGVAGLRLHYQAWESATPAAALLVVHGLGEHSGRYAAFGEDLARHGINVYALDQRGHGRSDGRRGHVRDFHRYLEDLERFRRTVSSDLPSGLPMYVLGHSLGGLIVLRYLQEFEGRIFAGAILSSPFLSQPHVASWKAAMARALSQLLPALPLGNQIDPHDLSSDPAVVKAYTTDPLVHDRVTPRLFTEIVGAVESAFRERGKLACPLLFLVSSADAISAPDRVLSFADSLGHLATSAVYDDCGHELLNDRRRTEVVSDILGWIRSR